MTRVADDPARLRAQLRELPPSPPDVDVLGQLRGRRRSRRRLTIHVLVPVVACATVAVGAAVNGVLPDLSRDVPAQSSAECPAVVFYEPPETAKGDLRDRAAAAFIPPGWDSATVCIYGPQHGALDDSTPAPPVVADLDFEQVADIAARLRRLPLAKGVSNCLADDGSGYLLRLSYPDGLLEVWVARTGCQLVSNGVRHGMWADNVGALSALAKSAANDAS